MHNKIARPRLYIILIAAFFLQLTVLDHARIIGAKPDLGLLMIIFFALFFGPGIGLESGFFFGLLEDIFSTGAFGVNIITLALTGMVAGFLSPKLFKESRMTQFLLVLTFTLLLFFMRYLVSFFIFKITYISLSEYLYGTFIPTAVYTSAASLFIYPLMIDKFGLKSCEEFL